MISPLETERFNNTVYQSAALISVDVIENNQQTNPPMVKFVRTLMADNSKQSCRLFPKHRYLSKK